MKQFVLDSFAVLALLADEQGWGILNIISMPYVLAVILAVILLDLAIYLQHVMFHAVPVFWRLHMVHHADLDFDVTTGARFHPIEIILSIWFPPSMALWAPTRIAESRRCSRCSAAASIASRPSVTMLPFTARWD